MKSQFVKIDDELTIHYETAGSGDQTILLLPGWTMSTRVFERQLAYFESSQQFRFITFDPRAHGLSSHTADGHFYPQHGRDLNAFVEALQLDQFVLGGWSFGTLATLAYINQCGSDKLKGFIMLDGPPRTSGPDNSNDWVTYRYDDADGGNRFYTDGKLENSETSLRQFATWLFENPSDDTIDWIMKMSAQMPNTAAALLNASASFLDYRKDLIALNGKIPLCYIIREDCREVTREWAHINTPTARIEAFGEHMMFWERAEEFNQMLGNFSAQCFEK